MAKPPRDGGWSPRHQRLAVANGFESWDDWCSAFEDEKGRTICGAIAKTVQRPCRNKPAENGRCNRQHGGKTPQGVASPNFEHGRKSRYLPKAWRDAFERHSEQRDALEALYALLALGQTQLEEQLKGVVGGVLEKVRMANRDMRATAPQNGALSELFLSAWESLELALEEGISDAEVMHQLQTTGEHIRKVADTIRRTERDQFEVVRADRLEALELFVVDTIRRACNETIVEVYDQDGKPIHLSVRSALIMKVAEDLDTAARGETPRMIEARASEVA